MSVDLIQNFKKQQGNIIVFYVKELPSKFTCEAIPITTEQEMFAFKIVIEKTIMCIVMVNY